MYAQCILVTYSPPAPLDSLPAHLHLLLLTSGPLFIFFNLLSLISPAHLCGATGAGATFLK